MRYADSFCTYTEEYKNGVQTCIFSGPCVVTGKKYSVRVPAQELYNYRQGKLLIQDAMPSVSAGDREFLMSGFSPEGWDLAFKNQEEDDYEEEEQEVS